MGPGLTSLSCRSGKRCGSESGRVGRHVAQMLGRKVEQRTPSIQTDVN